MKLITFFFLHLLSHFVLCVYLLLDGWLLVLSAPLLHFLAKNLKSLLRASSNKRNYRKAKKPEHKKMTLRNSFHKIMLDNLAALFRHRRRKECHVRCRPFVPHNDTFGRWFQTQKMRIELCTTKAPWAAPDTSWTIRSLDDFMGKKCGRTLPRNTTTKERSRQSIESLSGPIELSHEVRWVTNGKRDMFTWGSSKVGKL